MNTRLFENAKDTLKDEAYQQWRNVDNDLGKKDEKIYQEFLKPQSGQWSYQVGRHLPKPLKEVTEDDLDLKPCLKFKDSDKNFFACAEERWSQFFKQQSACDLAKIANDIRYEARKKEIDSSEFRVS